MVKKVIKMILRQFGLQLVQIHNNKVDQSPQIKPNQSAISDSSEALKEIH